MSDTTRGTRRNAAAEGAFLGAGVLLALALFALVNYLGNRHYARFDWTSSELYTLTEKSKAVVRGLDRDVEAVIFMAPGSETFGAVDELLSRYQAANPERFTKRVVDPARNLLEAQRLVDEYGIDRENVVVVATEDDRRVLDEYDMAEYDYSGVQMGQPPTLTELKGEQVITGAILAMVEASKPRVLFVTGHGEASLAGARADRSFAAARDMLGRDNFEVEEWSSVGATEVPAETDLVIVAGPETPFLPHELDALSRYLEGGGRVLMMLDPAFGTDGRLVDLGLGPWLDRYGIGMGDDLVLDPAGQMPFFGPETLFVGDFTPHPTVQTLAQTGGRALVTLARSLELKGPETRPDGVEASELMRTSDEAWGETDLENLGAVEKDDADTPGPLAIGVAVSFPVGTDFGPLAFGGAAPAASATGVRLADAAEEPSVPTLDPEAEGDPGADAGEADDITFDTSADESSAEDPPEGRLVVFGDADFSLTGQLGSMHNSTLLLNTLNWLIQREELIDIEARNPEQTKLSLTRSELSSIYWLVLGILPGLAIVLGISTHLRRRR